MSGVASQRQLSRLLTLLPYLRAHEGASPAEIAAEFGISESQVLKDLNLLWMCGLPGGAGGDLIDLSISEDAVSVIDSVGMDRALRLTAGEAMVLALALQMLVDQPSTVDPDAARSAIAKIEQATGVAVGGRTPAETDTDGGGAQTKARAADDRRRAEAAAPIVRDAVRDGRALELRYHSASRDAVSERVVDPVRIRLIDGHSYLQAWCRSAEGMRMFRFDRIDAATPVGAGAVPEAVPEDATVDLFRGGADTPSVAVTIAPEVAWMVEYFPLEDVEYRADGGVDARLLYGSPGWLARQLVGFGGAVRLRDDGADGGGADGAAAQIAEDARRQARAGLEAYGEPAAAQ